MTKNTNQKTTRHSEFISESTRHCECSEAIWTRLPRPNGLAMTNETGRSMVEMLGVLAVIGVLSITGISGYNTAMNKHRANEILDAASKRAVAVSTQIQRGNTSPTLDEFGDDDDNTVQNVKFGTPSTVGEKQFKIPLDWTAISDNDQKETLCQYMKQYISEDGENATAQIDEDCTRIVYNNDLSVGTNENENIYDPKTWCDGLNDGEGTLVNGTDCCASVSVSNPCQKCLSAYGSVVNKLDGSSCDSDGDGINDGICYQVEPTGGSCSGTDLSTLCLNGNQFQQSETSMCLPVSCKVLESMEVSTCCFEYNLNYILQQAQTIMTQEDPDESSLASLADQANIAQCVSCDSDTGNTTNLTDGTECQYVDLKIYRNTQQTISGKCQSGKCQSSCTGFKDEEGNCYPCNTEESVDVGSSWNLCTYSCPHRKVYVYDEEFGESASCVLNCPEGTLEDKDGHCLPCSLVNRTELKDPSKCSVCPDKEDRDGKCTLKCGKGHFLDRYGQNCISCATSDSVVPFSKEDCVQKCEDTFPRTMPYYQCLPKYTTCEEGYFYAKRGYSPSSTNTCESCEYTLGENESDYSGAWAIAINPGECSKCSQRELVYYKNRYYCYQTCPAGYLRTPYDGCKPCSDLGYSGFSIPAEECAKCDTTDTPWVMENSVCVRKNCPTGTAKFSGTSCIPCSANTGLDMNALGITEEQCLSSCPNAHVEGDTCRLGQ